MSDSYLITHAHLGREPVVSVSSPDDATRVTLAWRGATLLRWQVNRRGARVDLTDGYRDEAELRAQDGVRNGVLAPFPNRVANGCYTFAGIEYNLLTERTEQRVIYHGFARELPFDLAEAVVSPGGARLAFTARIHPDRHPGYPFKLDLKVTYVITADQIAVETSATNTGADLAPYAAGWHPYFRLPGTVDDWTLEIPARTIVRTDETLIPRTGPAAYQPLDDVPEQDFRQPRKLAGRVIDACFTDLVPGRDQRAETVLRHPESRDELRVWQLSGSMHVFTGDTLARDRRRSIALEPVEAVTDAFNREECASALRLEPGDTRTFRFGARHLPNRRSKPS